MIPNMYIIFYVGANCWSQYRSIFKAGSTGMNRFDRTVCRQQHRLQTTQCCSILSNCCVFRWAASNQRHVHTSMPAKCWRSCRWHWCDSTDQSHQSLTDHYSIYNTYPPLKSWNPTQHSKTKHICVSKHCWHVFIGTCFCLCEEMQKPPGKHIDIPMAVKLEKLEPSQPSPKPIQWGRQHVQLSSPPEWLFSGSSMVVTKAFAGNDVWRTEHSITLLLVCKAGR